MRRRARSGSRAAAVFEAALVAPLLLVIVVGIVEMALLMRDTVATSSAVRAAATVGAKQAGPASCDAATLACSAATTPAVAEAAAEAIEQAHGAIATDDIDWVIVYQANSGGFPLPESNRDRLACTTNCVRYVWDEDHDAFRYAGGSWASASINACAADDERTAIGVAMQARHSWITGIFGSSVTVDERSVTPIAPLPADACKPGRHL